MILLFTIELRTFLVQIYARKSMKSFAAEFSIEDFPEDVKGEKRWRQNRIVINTQPFSQFASIPSSERPVEADVMQRFSKGVKISDERPCFD